MKLMLTFLFVNIFICNQLVSQDNNITEKSFGNWEDILYDTHTDYKFISILNPDNIIITLFDTKKGHIVYSIINSSNQGKKWNILYDDNTEVNGHAHFLTWIQTTQYVSENNIYISAHSSSYYNGFQYTRDKGKTWTYIPLGYVTDQFTVLGFLDELNGFIGVVRDGQYQHSDTNMNILRTYDGGDNWEIFFIPDNDRKHSPPVAIYYFDKNNIYSINRLKVGAQYIDPIITYSTDGGETWNYKMFSDDFSFDFYFYNKDNFYSIKSNSSSENRTIIKFNGLDDEIGTEILTIETYLKQIKFYNEQVGFVIDYNNNFFYTSNGGESWFKEANKLNENVTVNKCDFINETEILCACLKYIYKYTITGTKVEDYSNELYSIYPNPSSDILHINTTALITRSELTDILGRTVFKQSGNVEQISTAGLAPGLYLLKLYTAGGEVLTEKVVVR